MNSLMSNTGLVSRVPEAFKVMLVSVLFVGAAGLAGVVSEARADNVYWSVGVASPGIQIGMSNAHPVVVMQAPVFVQRRPVLVQPSPVYVYPAPVYVSGWAPSGRAHGWHKRHDRHEGQRDHARAQPQTLMQFYIGPQAYPAPQAYQSFVAPGQFYRR